LTCSGWADLGVDLLDSGVGSTRRLRVMLRI